MGCWNGTCVLTNLPIMADEEVIVLLLNEGKSYDKYVGNHCHSNTYYSLLPLFFEGKYNDYGAVEECHGEFVQDIEDYIKKSLIGMELGENQYHDIEISKDKFDIDFLFDKFGIISI